MYIVFSLVGNVTSGQLPRVKKTNVNDNSAVALHVITDSIFTHMWTIRPKSIHPSGFARGANRQRIIKIFDEK